MMVELVEAVAMLAVTVGAILAVLSMGIGLESAESMPATEEVPPGSPVRASGVPEKPERREPMLPPNTVDVGGGRYLRVAAGCGAILHLVPQADGAAGARPALGAHASGDAPGVSGYDDALMRLPVWNVRTMCGLRWTAMAGHDAELAALIARAGLPTRPGDAGASYVCSVCAARVVPGRSAARGPG